MIKVRQALLEDIAAITRIYQSLVSDWTRRSPDGQTQAASYAELNLYERWQHGGPWLSPETCAIWMGHLLQRNEGIPLVGEWAGEVVAYAEVFWGEEPAPYGRHLNISTLNVHRDFQGRGLGRAMVAYAQEMAEVLACQQITVAYANPQGFWEKIGFKAQIKRQNYLIKTGEGRVFYRALALEKDDPQQIQNWYMAAGRFQNAREEWERMWWHIWTGIPQLVEAQWHRLEINLTGQPTLLHLHQHDLNPHIATARVWTQYEPSANVMWAVLDRAFRLDYEYIATLLEVPPPALVGEAQAQGEEHWLYAKPLAE